MIETLEDSLREEPVTEQEVERAKQQILKQRELEAADTDRIAVSLSEWAAQGDWRLYFLFRDIDRKLDARKGPGGRRKIFGAKQPHGRACSSPAKASERVEIPESPDLVAKLEGYKGRESDCRRASSSIRLR